MVMPLMNMIIRLDIELGQRSNKIRRYVWYVHRTIRSDGEANEMLLKLDGIFSVP